MNIYQLIQELINKGLEKKLIEPEDELYVRNRILSLLNMDNFIEGEPIVSEREIPEIPDILESLIAYACEQKIIEDFLDAKEILASKMMDCFISKPSVINHNFYERYEEKTEYATDYFYELSKNSNYIQTKRINKNVSYRVNTEYGELDITINLSKPEKDPKQIAKEKADGGTKTNYPKCLLCIENEGFEGRIGHPARSNHRMIRFNLRNEEWFLQYSPYVYYNEHCILLSKEHRDMKICKEAFLRLLLFVEKFPHYFTGSNADLPIVGGSILTHDHYQGGRYEFAMSKAKDEFSFNIDSHPQVKFSVLKWPMSVIRMRSEDIHSLVEAGGYILEKWKGYSDRSVDIHAFTNNTEHNTITPIARKKNNLYELDLVLRNNRTNIEHPLGIFHPHHDVHHIKKENIGLIEVMGLAVLPARLKSELAEVEKFLIDLSHNIAHHHMTWAEELKVKYRHKIDKESVNRIVKEEVGKKFLRCLEDAGVFKRNEDGAVAFKRFIETL
ncbi:UDP-glucose--hexose-1-phosphate uridylyltransferase [Peribacillus sp. ACCC06369]|uniref:UDP-glucose--hexose-1-phosphate uridylyltransferase n=1 Tax=Peribacillus sp. ACCC06369 TaxID=3055860 RepID=UPI0025A1ADF7|nr:UDP-glucose--hexose-1-phosphate uridylyltransferase [Peribacillus sp. ACCC06369]MDM5358204.1 UDP-glucose--hexose-1-phosphate uridylyltransferase [Peribacillus sp. ACCC06369]